MFEVGGFFLPIGERHFAQLGDDLREYGQSDRNAAYPYVKQWRRALDVGANVGIFSRDFAIRFSEVVAFEPIPTTRECLAANVPINVRIEAYAIADQAGTLKMQPTLRNCGGSFICNHSQVRAQEAKDGGAPIEVSVRTIDSYDFDAVDLIKLDIQGAEYLALLGARETILRCRPVVMVEQKPIDASDLTFKSSSRLLRSWGMVPKEKAQSDRVFVFEV